MTRDSTPEDESMTPELAETCCTRRGVLKAGSGLLGLTCKMVGSNQAKSSSRHQLSRSQETEQEWEVLEAEGFPFSVRYKSGYKSDAQKVREWGKAAHEDIQGVFEFTIQDTFTFDLIPANEYDKPHGNMTYWENEVRVTMVTPSEYAGSYSNTDLFYRHGVTHEYVHAVQNDMMDFHNHANWWMEGMAEAIAVYHTTDDIYESYHNSHRRARETRRDIRRGYGFLLGATEYVYRGAMHVIQFMFEEYGGQQVGEVLAQDATSVIEAIEMGLDISPLDLELAWLQYAQTEFGGDYVDAIRRLGGTVPGMISLETESRVRSDSVEINRALSDEHEFVIVVSDEAGQVIGTSRTFEAGSEVQSHEVQLDQSITGLQVLTAKLHHATDEGYGDPITVNGNAIAESMLVSPSKEAIDFAGQPEAGGTSVLVHAFVSSDYSAPDGLMVYVLKGDSTDPDDRIHDLDTQIGLKPGTPVVATETGLNESKASVPLTDGQTISLVIIDDATGDIVAKATTQVGGDQASDESNTTTPSLTGTATATATATVASTETAQKEGTRSETSTEVAERSDDRSQSPTRAPTTHSEESTQTDGQPGFGFTEVIVSLGGIGYLLKRRLVDS